MVSYTYIDNSPFYPTTAQFQYLAVVERYGGLSNLCQKCRFAYQQKVIKTFPDPWLSPTRGRDSLTMTFLGKFAQAHMTLK